MATTTYDHRCGKVGWADGKPQNERAKKTNPFFQDWRSKSQRLGIQEWIKKSNELEIPRKHEESDDVAQV